MKMMKIARSFALLLLTLTLSTAAVAEDSSRAGKELAVLLHIQPNNGGFRRQGKCTSAEMLSVKRAFDRKLFSQSDSVELSTEEPEWCHSLCIPHLSTPCMVVHPMCSHFNDGNVDDLSNQRRRKLSVISHTRDVMKGITNIFQDKDLQNEKDSARQAHALCSAETKSIKNKIKSALGNDVVSESCQRLLKQRITLSCFFVEADAATSV